MVKYSPSPEGVPARAKGYIRPYIPGGVLILTLNIFKNQYANEGNIEEIHFSIPLLGMI